MTGLTITDGQFLEPRFNWFFERGFLVEIPIMQMGNILPNIVDGCFVKGCSLRCKSRPLEGTHRYWKRIMNKAERRTAKMDLRKGGEIRFIKPITDNEIV